MLIMEAMPVANNIMLKAALAYIKYPLPKVPQKIMNILNPKQVAAFLTTTDKTTHIGARNHLIIMLLYDGGFRVSELLNIRLEDLRVHEGCIRVLGKGQKQRLVPISGLTKKEIIHFLNRFRPPKRDDTDYLFSRANGDPLSVNAVQQLLKRLGKTAGIAGVRCSPHTFRHSFATQFLANGGNVFALKDIMGHSSLQTTLKYTHLQVEDLKNQHNKFSPVAALVKSAQKK